MGRSPGGGHGNRLQNSSLENPTGREAWWATVHGVAQSQTQLSIAAMQKKDDFAALLKCSRSLARYESDERSLKLRHLEKSKTGVCVQNTISLLTNVSTMLNLEWSYCLVTM